MDSHTMTDQIRPRPVTELDQTADRWLWDDTAPRPKKPAAPINENPPPDPHPKLLP